MKLSVKQLTTAGLLLAICIASQYFKNLSVYFTGPIVNATLILATLTVGLWSGILLSIISPITAFFFTGSPIIAAIPLMFPVIIGGNIVLVLFTYYFQQKFSFPFCLQLGLFLGSFVKSIFMGGLVIFVIFPLFGENVASKLPNPAALGKVLSTAKITFSITQFITAILGSILAFLVWIPLSKIWNRDFSEK